MNMSVAALLAFSCALWAQAPLLPATPPPRRLPRAVVRALAPAELLLNLELPSGARLDSKTPLSYSIIETRGAIVLDMGTRRGEVLKPKLPLKILLRAPEGLSEVTLYVGFSLCETPDACRPHEGRYSMVLEGRKGYRRTKVPVNIAAD